VQTRIRNRKRRGYDPEAFRTNRIRHSAGNVIMRRYMKIIIQFVKCVGEKENNVNDNVPNSNDGSSRRMQLRYRTVFVKNTFENVRSSLVLMNAY